MPPPNILQRFARFLGLHSLRATGKDAYLIITLRSLRMFSAGIPSLILALFFASLDFPAPRIGLFMTLTLLGDVFLSLFFTLIADSIGRRKILFFGSVMMTLSGTAFALSENFWILLVAAVFGVISVTGADCGPFRAVEESVLSGLTDEKSRSDVLTWYVTATTMAGAVGSEVAGRVVSWVEKGAVDERHAFHVLFWGYAAFGLIGCILCLMLSPNCEIHPQTTLSKVHDDISAQEEEEVLLTPISPSSSSSHEYASQASTLRPLHTPTPKRKSYFAQISAPTRKIMIPLWILLSIDSLADGMTPYSLMNFYISQKFPHLTKSTLGDITSASQFLCAVSSIFAGPLSRRIGLINTMVFTHLPSSIASAFIPLPPRIGWTVALLLFRAALNSMDQAPRTAFIAKVVRPEERTGAMGITAMARTLAMSVGPSITGLLAGNDTFWAAFLATGICRVVYDLGLWVLFVNVEGGGGNGKGGRGGQRERERGDKEWGDEVGGLLSGSESDGDGSDRGSEELGRGRRRGSKDVEIELGKM